MEKFKCSICGKYIKNEFSNNAQPVNNGRCCTICNDTIVIPKRLEIILRERYGVPKPKGE